MTLESTINENRYVGNGAAKSFAFTFKAWKPSEVAVWTGDGTTETDVSAQCGIELTDTGGTVTFPAAPKSGVKIVIRRNMPYIQEDDYQNGSRFDAEEIEDRLDQDCAERQDLRLELGRAVKLPITSDMTADGLVQLLLQAIRDLQTAGDVSGQSLVRATGSTEYRPLADRFADMVNVMDFGAKGDGVTDDTAAFNAAAAAAGGRFIYLPAGEYALSSAPAGLYFSDGKVDTGDVDIALTDFGDIRASEYLDVLDFGLLGYVRRRIEFPTNTDAYVAQGMTTDGETYLYVGQHHNDETQYITKYNVTTRTVVSQTKYTTLGHVNNLDYKDGELYVATLDSDSRIAVINAETMEIDRYITPVTAISSVAWDNTRNCWWCTSGTAIKRLTEDFGSLVSSVTVPFADGEIAGQGVTCFEGMLYFPRYRNDEGTGRQRGHVAYVYDPLVERVVHKWDIAFGVSEIEDFCFYNGYLITSAAASSSYNYFIYATKFKKGLHTTFGPLIGENKQLPCYKPQHGTEQSAIIYVDAGATSQGLGTEDSPFNSIEMAFVAHNMTPYSKKTICLKGDCTEGGHQDKLWFQGWPTVFLRGWDNNSANNIMPGFSATQCQFFRVENLTIKPYVRADGRASGYNDAVYITSANVYFTGVSWNTSAYPGTLEGLVYASGASDITIASMDFTNVAASKISGDFLVKTTDGSTLHLIGQASSITVPSGLSDLRVFDCKGLCDSYYTGFDDMVFKDATLYVQNVVSNA